MGTQSIPGGKRESPGSALQRFLRGTVSEAFGDVQPVHKGGTAFADLNQCLPKYVCDSLKEGIEAFGHKIQNYNRGDAFCPGWKRGHPLRSAWSGIRNFNQRSGGFIHAVRVPDMPAASHPPAMDGLRIAEAIRKVYCPNEG